MKWVKCLQAQSLVFSTCKEETRLEADGSQTLSWFVRVITQPSPIERVLHKKVAVAKKS